MRVGCLKIANVRAIEQAEFHFQTGFNLIVGANGVGKSTVLETLAVCLGEVIQETTRIKSGVFLGRRFGVFGARFRAKDIRVGVAALDIECDCVRGGERYCSTVIHEEHDGDGGLRHRRSTKPVIGVREGGAAPLAVLFSTSRAVPSRSRTTTVAATGRGRVAYEGALMHRELRLHEIAAWMEARRALGNEDPDATRVLSGVEDAVRRFLPGYDELRAGGAAGDPLLINRGGAPLPVGSLSDGERGMLALVLDLTRRLALANPDLDDPAATAEAVVLIDELELHLHPQWQRHIVRNLTAAFPRCQFIATTHSPQIIGEVEHDRIHIMTGGEVYSPTHSFGVDSSRVLEEIMEAEPRSAEAAELISRISRSIGKKLFKDARQDLQRLTARLGENDADVAHLRTYLDLVEGDE